MATFPFDDLTLNSLMQSLPELQRKKRRAEQLRQTQEHFREMGEEQPTGMMLPTQKGSMYDTVSEYRPDYAGMANKGIGALGEYLTGRKAEEAQGGYDEDQTAALLGMSQQLGNNPVGDTGAAGLDAAAADEARARGPMPTQDTLRLAMGMVGGPEIKDFLPRAKSDRKLHGVKEDEQGNVWNIYDTGEVEKTDIKGRAIGGRWSYDEPTQSWTFFDPRSMTARTIKPEDPDYPGAPSDPSNPIPPSTPPSLGGSATTLSRSDLHARQKQAESGGDPNALSPVGAFGPMQLMPETAAEMEQKFGLPPGSSKNPRVNEMLGQAYMDEQLERFGNDQEAALIAYNAGAGNAEKWLAAGRDYAVLPKREETEPYVRKILGGGPAATGASVSATGNVPGVRPGFGRKLTPREEAAQKAEVELQTKAATMKLERQQAAKNALSKTKLTTDPGATAARDLLTHPGLAKITGGTLGSFADAIGRKDDQGGYSFFGLGALARPALAANDEQAADALAMIDQIRGSAFATGFQALVGQGAGSISNQEGQGIARALSNLETARSLPAMKKALQDYADLTDAIKDRWEREAAGEQIYNGPLAAAPSQQLQADPEIDALVKRWGNQ